MQPRLDFFAEAPQLMKYVASLNRAVEESGIDKGLLHLVKLRASQINGCSYCVEMHSREAREDGESEGERRRRRGRKAAGRRGGAHVAPLQ